MRREPIRASAGGGGDFEQPKVKPTAAVIGDVVDIGWQGGGAYEPRRQILVAWELDQRDSRGSRFVLWTPYTLSVNEKATLRKVVDDLDPDQVPDEPPTGFTYDVTRLIGKTALVSLKSKETARGTKVQVSGVMSMPDGMRPITAEADYSKPGRLVEWFTERALREEEAKSMIREIRAKKAAEEAHEADPVPVGTAPKDDIPF